MTDDDPGEFRAPPMQPVTPPAVKAAGARLHAYATANGVPRDVPILEMELVGEPEEVAELARDQRFLLWYTEQAR